MANNTPFYCLLTAMIARTTLAASVIWCLAALFSGQGNFITHGMWLSWIACAGLFLLNQMLLKKERTALVFVAADIIGCVVMVSTVYTVFSNDGPVITFFMGICVFIGAMSHVMWIYRGFSDHELTVQIQFLALSAGLQMATGELMMKEAAWAGMTVAVIVLLLIATAMSKHSGIKEKAGRLGTGLKSAGLCIIITVIMVIIAIAAYGAAVPASNIISFICDILVKAAKAVMTAIGHIYIFLTSIFSSSEVSAPPGGGSSGGGGEYWGEASGNLDFVKVVFAGIILVFIAVMLVALLDSLRRMLMKKAGGSVVGGTAEKHSESILKRLKMFVRAVLRHLKITFVLIRHPHSMAALLIKLERKCRKNSLFRRSNGETAREFIMRAAKLCGNDELRDVLNVFADEVDAAFYGREKNYLKEFSQHKKMLKTLKNSLTTRV